MGLNPQSRWHLTAPRAATGTAPSGYAEPASPKAQDDRPRRPLPARTGPIRAAQSAWHAGAQDAPAASGASPQPARPAAERSIESAYQVFDEYLEEGRRFAEGQSAWFADDAGQPDLPRDAARSFADLLGLLGRFAQELTKVAPSLPNPTSVGSPLPNPAVLAAARPRPSAGHVAPRIGTTKAAIPGDMPPRVQDEGDAGDSWVPVSGLDTTTRRRYPVSADGIPKENDLTASLSTTRRPAAIDPAAIPRSWPLQSDGDGPHVVSARTIPIVPR